MVSYQLAQKRRVRITLDLEVMSDFNPRDIDFQKLFKLEPNESVETYIEDADDLWWEYHKPSVWLLTHMGGFVV